LPKAFTSHRIVWIIELVLISREGWRALLYVKQDAKEELLHWIKRKQEEMIEIGTAKGISHKETLQCSQELDDLLTSYQRLTSVNQLRS